MAPKGNTQIQYNIRWVEEVDQTYETRLSFEDWNGDFSRGMSRESVLAKFDELDECALRGSQKRKRKQ